MTPEKLEQLYATMKASGEMTAAALRRWRQQNRLAPDESLAAAPDPARRADGSTLESLGKVVAPVPLPRASLSRPRRPRQPAKRGTAVPRFVPDARSRWDLLEVD